MATGRTRKRPEAGEQGQRTVAGWRANALDLQLSAKDLDLLDNVMTVTPILRVVAAIGQQARKRGLTYPVSAVGALQSCLRGKTLLYGDHRLDKHTIARAMHESWFPIMHEGELLSRVHLALLRCEMEAAQLAPRPSLQAR
jgi:hypothetical protein